MWVWVKSFFFFQPRRHRPRGWGWPLGKTFQSSVVVAVDRWWLLWEGGSKVFFFPTQTSTVAWVGGWLPKIFYRVVEVDRQMVARGEKFFFRPRRQHDRR
jgi:hypothetical protein